MMKMKMKMKGSVMTEEAFIFCQICIFLDNFFPHDNSVMDITVRKIVSFSPFIIVFHVKFLKNNHPTVGF
jgi:hypothetical protein